VAGVLALACLSTTPARAGFGWFFRYLSPQTFQIFLNDVNADGTQGANSTPAVPFYTLINTLNGNFAGAAKGKVVNNANAFEYYYDSFSNLIDSSSNTSYVLAGTHDLYVVYANGYAIYIATGTSTPI
jgi:hypothetical protein